jgi:hypothetical protein
MATVPFAASNALARMVIGASQMLSPERRPAPPAPDGAFAYPAPNQLAMDPRGYVLPTEPGAEGHALDAGGETAEAEEAREDALEGDVAALKRELAELRAVVKDVANAQRSQAARDGKKTLRAR